jgi:hypothetical protein
MVIALSITVFVLACLLGGTLVAFARRERQFSADFQREREASQERGRDRERQAGRDLLWRELGIAVNMCQLTAKPGSHVPSKWQKAFSLLLPQSRGPSDAHFDADVVAQELLKLDFKDWEVRYLMNWRANHPPYLVVLLVALMSGVSEEGAWNIACDV